MKFKFIFEDDILHIFSRNLHRSISGLQEKTKFFIRCIRLNNQISFYLFIIDITITKGLNNFSFIRPKIAAVLFFAGSPKYADFLGFCPHIINGVFSGTHGV